MEGMDTPPLYTQSPSETCTTGAVSHLLCSGGGAGHLTALSGVGIIDQKSLMQIKEKKLEIALGALDQGKYIL